MSFEQAILSAIAEIETAIAAYHDRGEDPPHYLTSQWADLKAQSVGVVSPNPSAKIRFDFNEFADTWTVQTPTLSYPQVAITVTEMQGFILNSPLSNVITSVDVLPNGAIVQFFVGSSPIEVKGFLICI